MDRGPSQDECRPVIIKKKLKRSMTKPLFHEDSVSDSSSRTVRSTSAMEREGP